MRFYKLVLVFILCLSGVFQAKSQNLTGTDFWFMMPFNESFQNNQNATNEIFIVSQYCIDSAYIDVGAYNERIYFSVEPGNFNRVVIPYQKNGQVSYPQIQGFGGGDLNQVVNKGVHIVS
ncbi:MAG: hypothetical protein ACPF8V_03005, partial [Luteibaculum sp.]